MDRLRELLGPHGFIEERGRDAVLLVHGLTGTPAEMRYMARHLARRGFTVVCPQLAGHCTSVEALKRSRWQDWFDSVESTWESMKERYHHVFVSGLSMGANMALLLAAKHGARVDGVGLLSATFVYDGWNVPRIRRRILLPLVLHSPLRHFLSWNEPPPYGIKDERMRAMVTAVLAERDARTADRIGHFRTPGTTVLETTRLIRATRKCLPDVTAPTLIVHSVEDDMASVRNAHLVARRIRATRVETYLVDDCYHVLTLDKRRNAVFERVAHFFSDCAIAAPTPA